MTDYDDRRVWPEVMEDERPTTLATYTLRVMGPEGWPDFPDAARGLGGALSEAEENLNDLLPEGYYIKIEEWDESDGKL